jgi:hypothetical protein
MEGKLNVSQTLDGSDLPYSIAYYGGNKNDKIIGSADYGSIFNTGAKGNKTIVSGSNQDTINVNNFSNTNTKINDNTNVKSDVIAGYIEDELNLYTSTKGDGAYLFFDVALDEFNPPEDYSSNLYIIKNTGILNYMSGKSTSGFVSIENYFAGRQTSESNGFSDGSGVIENISFNDGRLDVNGYINRVTADVKEALTLINANREEKEKETFLSVM